MNKGDVSFSAAGARLLGSPPEAGGAGAHSAAAAGGAGLPGAEGAGHNPQP